MRRKLLDEIEHAVSAVLSQGLEQGHRLGSAAGAILGTVAMGDAVLTALQA